MIRGFLKGWHGEWRSPWNSLVCLRCEEGAGQEAGRLIMERLLNTRLRRLRPASPPNCCFAVPATCRAFPPEHATATRTHVIKSESTPSLPKSMPPFNSSLWWHHSSHTHYRVLSVLSNASHNHFLYSTVNLCCLNSFPLTWIAKLV